MFFKDIWFFFNWLVGFEALVLILSVGLFVFLKKLVKKKLEDAAKIEIIVQKWMLKSCFLFVVC